ncbi:MAG: GntR family transcriptional regulator [Terriglobia bacterium]
MKNSKPQAQSMEFSSGLGPRLSLPFQVAQIIRGQIRSGKLASGERLVETRIAKQLGIGQATVREALKTLESEGLVTQRPLHGYSVTTLNEQELDQICRLRVALEVIAIEHVIENKGKWNPSQLEAPLERMKQAAARGDVEEYYRIDLEFHETLWGLSGNPFLVRALTQVAIPLFAFCMIKRLRDLDLDLVANVTDHETIVRAILGGNKDAASEISRQMLEKFWKFARNLSDHGTPEPRTTGSSAR